VVSLRPPDTEGKWTFSRSVMYRGLPPRVGFRKGASLPLFVGLYCTLNGHLYFEGVGGANIGPNAL